MKKIHKNTIKLNKKIYENNIENQIKFNVI